MHEHGHTLAEEEQATMAERSGSDKGLNATHEDGLPLDGLIHHELSVKNCCAVTKSILEQHSGFLERYAKTLSGSLGLKRDLAPEFTDQITQRSDFLLKRIRSRILHEIGT